MTEYVTLPKHIAIIFFDDYSLLKTLAIKDVPFGITTQQLVDSILKANDSGKIKIKSVTDNTAKDVELIVQLAPGISTDQTIDALYLFTDCFFSLIG